MEKENIIQKNIDLIKDTGCEGCRYCSMPSFDYEGGYTEPGYCNLEGNENYGNLKSFPFKKHKDCFKPDIWFLIGIDSDICELHEKSFNLDMEGHIEYDNDRINLKDKNILQEKSKEVVKKMHKLAKERYGFN